MPLYNAAHAAADRAEAYACSDKWIRARLLWAIAAAGMGLSGNPAARQWRGHFAELARHGNRWLAVINDRAEVSGSSSWRAHIRAARRS